MAVTLHLTRDSVAAGDDVDAPHEKCVTIPGPISTPVALQEAAANAARDYLPSVAGRATWAAYCGLPLMVLSNRGAEPRLFFLLDQDMPKPERVGGFRIQFIYFGIHDPAIVFDILSQTHRVRRNA